jgi:outer membrane protein assembly factor BamB
MSSIHAMVAIATLLDCLASCVSAEDWPRWRGPRGDGTWNAPLLPEVWPKSGLKRIWRQQIGAGYAGVVVAGTKVFTMDRQTQPQELERVLCLDAATGSVLWTHDYPVAYGKLDYGNGPRAAPTVFDNRVYTLGAVGHVSCLDAASGELVWLHDMIGDFGARLPEWGFAASPVIFDNLVIIHTGAEPDGCFIAFDRLTGKEVWRGLADSAGYCTPIVIEHAGRPVLVCWTPENVHGLDPHTGRIFWSVPYKVTYGVSIATPIFQEETVFVSGYWEGAKAIRLGHEASQHELAWQENRWLRGLMSQPLYRRGYAYMLDKQHGLICFELKSGKKIWDDASRMTPRGRNPHASLVWLNSGNEDRAIILNADGDLILARLNPTGYLEQSRTNIISPSEGRPIWAHPAYAGSFVYARNDREILCRSLIESADP